MKQNKKQKTQKTTQTYQKTTPPENNEEIKNKQNSTYARQTIPQGKIIQKTKRKRQKETHNDKKARKTPQEVT